MVLAALLGVALVAGPFSTACATPRGTPVTYQNETDQDLTLTSDQFFLVTLLPGQSKKITTKESLLPDRIKAMNARGDVVFDRTVTWEDLKATGFLVVIR